MSEPWRDALSREADDALRLAIANSEHPDARRFMRWLTHECLPALDPFGLRGPPGTGEYVWPALSPNSRQCSRPRFMQCKRRNRGEISTACQMMF
jgi:hypothetical protein